MRERYVCHTLTNARRSRRVFGGKKGETPPLTNWCGEVPPPLPFFSTNVKREGERELGDGEREWHGESGGEREKKGLGKLGERLNRCSVVVIVVIVPANCFCTVDSIVYIGDKESATGLKGVCLSTYLSCFCLCIRMLLSVCACLLSSRGCYSFLSSSLVASIYYEGSLCLC